MSDDDDYESKLDKDAIILVLCALVAIALCVYGTFKHYGL